MAVEVGVDVVWVGVSVSGWVLEGSMASNGEAEDDSVLTARKGIRRSPLIELTGSCDE